MEKIYILGTSGSGKSTLAKKMSDALNISTYDLDDICWHKKYTKKRSKEDREIMFKELMKGKKKWIIDGIFTDFSRDALPEADLIIWMNTRRHVLSWRIFKRYLGRRGTCEETLKNCIGLIKYANRYYSDESGAGYKRHKEIVEGHDKEVVVLRNKRDVRKFLERV